MARKSLPLIAIIAATLGAPAWAHHPLAGKPMTDFHDGLLSGIGHPVLGFDHLFFIIAVGLLSSQLRLPVRGICTYLAAMAAGSGASTLGFSSLLTEPVIAISLIAAGGIVASGKSQNRQTVLAIFTVFGLFHGFAFGDAITAQESASASVLGGYLLGLSGIQFAVALGAATLARFAAPTKNRFVGSMVAGAGLFIGLEMIEGPIVAALIG